MKHGVVQLLKLQVIFRFRTNLENCIFEVGVSAKYIYTAKRLRMQAFITFNCINIFGAEQVQIMNGVYDEKEFFNGK